MRIQTFTATGMLVGALLVSTASAQATTFVSGRGGNGNERCLAGADSIGQSGEIGKTCTGGGSYDGRLSIVDLIIADIGGGLAWERVDDPNDSFFTFLAGSSTTQVRGRARYAGNNNAFGATLQDGSYQELIGGLPGNTVLLSDCSGITKCGALDENFIELDGAIAGLSPGALWKPTLDVSGNGTTFYTSLAADNWGQLDHMVAFKTVDPVNDPGTDGFNAFRYILGFEDLRNLGDIDYNDYVVEIFFSSVATLQDPAAVPAPGALALFGFGLLGAAGARRLRRLRKS